MSRRHGSNIAPTAIGYAHKLMDHSSDPTKYISIEVLSSKDRVRICVDDATVILYFQLLSYYLTAFYHFGKVKQ